MQGPNNTAGQWVAAKLRTEASVVRVELLAPGLLRVVRSEGDPVVVAAISIAQVGKAELVEVLRAPEVAFVVNLARESFVTPEAFQLSESHKVPLGRMGDLTRALRLSDVRGYVSREVEYLSRGLRQHSRIKDFARLDERRYRIIREGHPPLTVVMIDDYEVTADSVRTARERYGAFDIVVAINPNRRITKAAVEAAELIGVRLYSWRDFYSALNRE